MAERQIPGAAVTLPIGEVICGDCLDVLRGWPDNSVDCCICDPPYGLSFMGKKWDYDVPSVELWREVYRVLKDGGRLLAFSGARTQHRMVCNIEDAGFTIEDCMMWLYGSGFPKHGSKLKPAYEPICVARKGKVSLLNIDAARIDSPGGKTGGGRGPSNGAVGWQPSAGYDATAGRWPANICLDTGYEGSAAAMLDEQSGMSTGAHGGVGGDSRGNLNWKPPQNHPGFGDSGGASRFFKTCEWSDDDKNICRAKAVLETWNQDFANTAEPGSSLSSQHAAFALSVAVTLASQGAIRSSEWKGLSTTVTARELKQLALSAIMATLNIASESSHEPPPERLILSSNPAKSAEPQGPTATTTITASLSKSAGFADSAMSNTTPLNTADGAQHSRTFYCAKASASERNSGLSGMPERGCDAHSLSANGCAVCGLRVKWNGSGVGCECGPARVTVRLPALPNHHPTVKPLALMQWLVRLATFPGETVLDPFFGSGTTGVACNREGRKWIGIDRDESYCAIARKRTAQKGLALEVAS